jgi:ketosteroid isomerase-like protein
MEIRMDNPATDIEEVRAALDRVNAAWLMEDADGIAASLTPLFEEEAVIAGPGFAPMATGRAACVNSYVDFRKQAEIHSCTFTDPSIHVAGAAAVATCEWEIVYTMKGVRYQETGHDVYVFARTGDKWLMMWRAMLTS